MGKKCINEKAHNSCITETTSIYVIYLSYLHVPLETTLVFGLLFNIMVQKFNNQIFSGC